MIVTDPTVTLQVRGDDKVLEPYRIREAIKAGARKM
jgi:hypothetical protein